MNRSQPHILCVKNNTDHTVVDFPVLNAGKFINNKFDFKEGTWIKDGMSISCLITDETYEGYIDLIISGRVPRIGLLYVQFIDIAPTNLTFKIRTINTEGVEMEETAMFNVHQELRNVIVHKGNWAIDVNFTLTLPELRGNSQCYIFLFPAAL